MDTEGIRDWMNSSHILDDWGYRDSVIFLHQNAKYHLSGAFVKQLAHLEWLCDSLSSYSCKKNSESNFIICEETKCLLCVYISYIYIYIHIYIYIYIYIHIQLNMHCINKSRKKCCTQTFATYLHAVIVWLIKTKCNTEVLHSQCNTEVLHSQCNTEVLHSNLCNLSSCSYCVID